MTRGIKRIFCLAVTMLCATTPLPADEADGSAVVSGEKRISVNVDKGEITDALRLIAQQGGLNISIGPGVKGEVTVYLTDASLEAALEAVTTNNGFVYSVENGIISVSKASEDKAGEAAGPPPLTTRTFQLRCQDAARVKDALRYALTPHGKMAVLNENSESPFSPQRLTDLSGEYTDGQSGTNTTGQLNATAGQPSGMASGTGQNMSPTGQIRSARFLVVTDVEKNMAAIADLIADLDHLPPQVLIEARIVEMTTQLQRQLGIDWDVNVLANGPILNHELPVQLRAGFASGTQIRRTVTGGAQSTVGLALGTVDFTRFLALLRVHESDNAVRLLANPRLLVFNNSTGNILVGERYPILEANITDQGTLTEAFSTYIPIGIQLEVIPTIMNDGRISLYVHPSTSSLGDNVIGTTGLAVRRITTRELNTRVVMQDGQTVVLGGLISDRKTRQANKIPGLGDLPVISWFTRQESPTSERVDLLVFLTVHVEGGDEINERDLEVLEKYRPHFKQIQKLQDVPLHFEIPTEYEEPKPMFGDPPETPVDPFEEETPVEETTNEPAAEVRSPVAHPSETSAKADRPQKSPAGKSTGETPVPQVASTGETPVPQVASTGETPVPQVVLSGEKSSSGGSPKDSPPRFKARVGRSMIRPRRGSVATPPPVRAQANAGANDNVAP